MGISRRSLLSLSVQSVAGASLLNAVPGTGLLSGLNAVLGEPVFAAGAEADALVCVYFFGGIDRTAFQSGGRLHPGLGDLSPLQDRKILKIVGGVTEPVRLLRTATSPGEVNAQRYSALRLLPNGFATLEWAAQLAQVDPLTGAGAFTFESGLSLVAPGAKVDGPWFENPAIRAAASNCVSVASLPDSSLGRQLGDVVRLLAARQTLGMGRQVFLVSATGFSRAAMRADQLETRYRDLGRALAAFHAATEALGVDRRVVTFTDGDLTSGSGGGSVGARLVIGTAIDAPEHVAALTHDAYARTMARSVGAAANAL